MIERVRKKIESLTEEIKRIEEKQKQAMEKERRKAVKKSPESFQGYFYDASRNKYRVQFSYSGKRYRFGSYDTHWEAHAVYLEERAKIVAEEERHAEELRQKARDIYNQNYT